MERDDVGVPRRDARADGIDDGAAARPGQRAGHAWPHDDAAPSAPSHPMVQADDTEVLPRSSSRSGRALPAPSEDAVGQRQVTSQGQHMARSARRRRRPSGVWDGDGPGAWPRDVDSWHSQPRKLMKRSAARPAHLRVSTSSRMQPGVQRARQLRAVARRAIVEVRAEAGQRLEVGRACTSRRRRGHVRTPGSNREASLPGWRVRSGGPEGHGRWTRR